LLRRLHPGDLIEALRRRARLAGGVDDIVIAAPLSGSNQRDGVPW